ncbi:MAG TPA: hypothetical protein VNW46_03595 [Gemmatimonadaceae bacterium]|jgi:hypothetical protein|nr:hypothetical protein [Gemmatimonadaceae bacterium]
MMNARVLSFRRRIVSAFTERLGYKAVAIFLAFALWFFTHLSGHD